mmetsp:Transcript_30329/g.70771  ORF Transcript_30329/g.70771 Transcript_30329/m.70771 type:complete len:213 (+) Transcript_30329:1078-1716(+)
MIHFASDGVQQGVDLHRLLLKVESDCPVVNLHIRDLLHHHLELIVGECNGAVSHHAGRSGVILIVVHVQVHHLLPVLVSLAGVDQLWNVELGCVHLDEIHEPLRLVLGIQAAQLGVEPDVGALRLQAVLQQGDELFEVSPALVGVDKLLQVVWVHNDVHACGLCASELLGSHAGQVDFLPSAGIVGLLCGIDSLGVLTELHMALGQLGVVGD